MVSPLHTPIGTCPSEEDVVTLRLSRGMVGQGDLPPAEPVSRLECPRDYELLALLGRGGMGVVYLARQRDVDRHVAYKVLTSLGSHDPDTLARFRGEARTLARL